MKGQEIRKIIPIGGSLGITVPRQWISLYEKTHGKTREVLIEVRDESLTLTLIAPVRETKEIMRMPEVLRSQPTGTLITSNVSRKRGLTHGGTPS